MPSLLLGFLVSALVTVLMPNDFLEGGLGDGFSGLFIALVLSIPIYICASSSTPIAAALIAKGLSPGAGLVFLLVGPATNIGSLLVVGKELGRRVLFIYLSSVALVALLFGIIVNGFYSWRGEGPQTIVSDVVHGPGGSLQLVSALLLGLFCLGSLSRHVFLRSLVAKLLPGSSARKEAAER